MGDGAAGGAPGGRLRLVSANAASGRDRRTGRLDLAPWARGVAGLDADVLAVQEVDHLLARSGDADQTAVIAETCAGGGSPWAARFAAAVHGTPGSTEGFSPAEQTVSGRPSYGVALLSRHPVERWWELRLAPSRARIPVPLPPGSPTRMLWVPDEPRVAVAGRVRAPGGPVTVVSTHLSFDPTRATRQLRQVAAWVRTLPGPRVLLGDLNLPGGWPARVSGMRPAARVRTYPAGRPAAQLDHVLLDDPATRLAVFDAGAHLVGGSDHRALVVDLLAHPGRAGE